MCIIIWDVQKLVGDAYSREWVSESISEQRAELYELLIREIDKNTDNENLLISIKQEIDYLNHIAPFKKC